MSGLGISLLDHTSLDVGPCHLVEFVANVEGDIGPFLGVWPTEIRDQFSRSVALWRKHNPGSEIIACTSGCRPCAAGGFTASVALHHVRPSAPAAAEQPSPSPAPAQEGALA